MFTLRVTDEQIAHWQAYDESFKKLCPLSAAALTALVARGTPVSQMYLAQKSGYIYYDVGTDSDYYANYRLVVRPSELQAMAKFINAVDNHLVPSRRVFHFHSERATENGL